MFDGDLVGGDDAVGKRVGLQVGFNVGYIVGLGKVGVSVGE